MKDIAKTSYKHTYTEYVYYTVLHVQNENALNN